MIIVTVKLFYSFLCVFLADNYNMDAADFWNTIKILIKQANTTQRGLSSTCGFSPRAIEAWIAAGQLPDAFQTFKIAQALGVSMEYLVTGKEPEVSVPRKDLADLKDLLMQAVNKIDKL